ncbi:hypothetical protein TWF281_010681 [Arthrobotrys megalospora]
MPSLSKLPVELLHLIISNLRRNDVTSFLRTSKHFYSAIRPWVWSTFTIDEYSHRSYNDECKYFFSLVDLTREVGTDALGYKYIKKIRILSPAQTFVDAPSKQSGFHTVLLDLIESGKIDLQEVYIQGNGIYWWPISWTLPWAFHMPRTVPEEYLFLRRLKKYSESKSVNEFSMGLATGDILALIKADTLNLSIFTKLTICIDLVTTYETISSAFNEWGKGDDHHFVPDQCDEYLTMLPQVLTQAVELKELRLGMKTRFYEPVSIYGPKLSEPLKALQTTISGMKRLRLLSIGNEDGKRFSFSDGILFHPSFFVAPPENCKVVEYCATVSVAWWRQFASHSFPGVEELKLNISSMKSASRRWMGESDEGYPGIRRSESERDEEATKGLIKNWDFRLGSVAVTGLKKFQMHTDIGWREEKKDEYPRDLADCIRRENTHCSVTIT